MNTTIMIIAGLIVLAGVAYALRNRIRGRPVPDELQPGQSLPVFAAVDENGQSVGSADLIGKPAILLFVRGSWCPFCSRQVANLTGVYKRITDAGARLILVTPKPLATTRRVAEIFDVDFEFWLDEGLAIGERLGLTLKAGVPNDHREEYGEDTLWPAALVIDADGIIRYSELSRFIADRPNPEKLLNVVKRL